MSGRTVTYLVVVFLVGIAIGGLIGYEVGIITYPEEAQPEEVRIGWLFTLTGWGASFGNDMKIMAEICVDEVNDAGGIQSLGGRKLRLVPGDSECKAEIAKIETRRLITEEKVHILGGAFSSALTFAASEEAEKLGIPFVNGFSSHVNLTERGYETFFRAWGTDLMFTRQQYEFLNWLKEEKNAELERVAIIHDDTAWGIGSAKAYNDLSTDPEFGYEVVRDITFSTGVSDVTSEVLSLKDANPDVVFYSASNAGDAILWITTFKKYDLNVKVFIGNAGGVNLPEYMAVEDGWYVCCREAWSQDLLDTAWERQELAQKYQEKFYDRTGKTLYGHPVTIYTAMTVIVEALEKAGSTDPDKLIDALRTLKIGPEEMIFPWDGIEFDSKGQNIHAINFIAQLLDDGAYHIVYPSDVATGDVVYPMPTWSER